MTNSIRFNSRANLSPERMSEIKTRMARNNRDLFYKHVDFELWDCIQNTFDKRSSQQVFSDLREAALDERVTKTFRNVEATMESIEHYKGSEVPSFIWNENFRLASALLEKYLKVTILKPLQIDSVDSLLDSMTNKSASAGAICDGSKGENAPEILDEFFKMKSQIAEGLIPRIPCLLFHRSQISGYYVDDHLDIDSIKYKDRAIWGSDAASVAIEAQYARPLIEHLSRNCNWYAGGKHPDELRGFIYNGSPNANWYSLDFSKFDQTVPSWLIRHVFWLIKKFYPEQCFAELDWVEDNFINTEIVTYYGDVFTKHRGIPSGSHFTQVVGSMCNMLVILTYIIKRGRDVNTLVNLESYVEGVLDYNKYRGIRMFVMGDDNLFYSRTDVDLEDMSRYVQKNFGMVIHPDKTESFKSTGNRCPSFLKRTWTMNGEKRNVSEMLINVIHPERPRKYDTYRPIHIIYGLFLTYKGSMSAHITEKDILKTMSEDGGIEGLRQLKPNDLPGSLRILGDKAGEYMYRRAKASLGLSD